MPTVVSPLHTPSDVSPPLDVISPSSVPTNDSPSSAEPNVDSPSLVVNNPSGERPPKISRLESSFCDIDSLERDPGLRLQICDYSPDEQVKIRCAYLQFGPYQPELRPFPSDGNVKHPRRFNLSWYKSFPWLEYSPIKDAAFCLPCFVFNNTRTSGHCISSEAFTIKGFRSWKKVNDGAKCALLGHIGKGPNSAHKVASQACQDLMKFSQHIDKVFAKQSSERKAKARLRVKVSIDVARWLAFQACAFRGHDEGLDSRNRGNFIELIKMISLYNEDVANTVLENAPRNAKYTSPDIQKEILGMLARKVRNAIREDIGDAKFCLIVDEARDESKREQMAIVLRFVDKDGILRERFFDVVHVPNTSAATLKKEISGVLSRNNLSIMSIRGQGYDGASNMRGEWNGLQALFINECPYAYFIHCFAHRLQLALVAAAKEVDEVYEFFLQLSSVINAVTASCKRNDELHIAQAKHLSELLDTGEIESGRGLNQIGTLQRPGDTRWSSHFTSVCSLIKMFDAACTVLDNIKIDGCTYSQRGDANIAYNAMTSFEFVFILHLMREIMGITNSLCLVLQSESQDILNALQLVKSTKVLLQELRESGWDTLLQKVRIFCDQNDMEVPDMSSSYLSGSIKRHQKKKGITNDHHYRVDIFIRAIDTQREELNRRFNEHTIELFVLSASLDPKDGYKLFKEDDICDLVDRYYPHDFSEQEKIHLRYELQHYILDVRRNEKLKNLSTLSELCQGLVKTGRSLMHPLVYRLICLVLTLPVSTATTERAFSAMKMVKSRLRNKMEDGFLADCMVLYIEKEIAERFHIESLIDEFRSIQPLVTQFFCKGCRTRTQSPNWRTGVCRKFQEIKITLIENVKDVNWVMKAKRSKCFLYTEECVYRYKDSRTNVIIFKLAKSR